VHSKVLYSLGVCASDEVTKIGEMKLLGGSEGEGKTPKKKCY